MAETTPIRMTLGDSILINAFLAWVSPTVSGDRAAMLEGIIAEHVNRANHDNPHMAELIEQARRLTAIDAVPAEERREARASIDWRARCALRRVAEWRLGDALEAAKPQGERV